jgi:predicted DNA-binding transcriptional regulator YafY
MNRTDRLYALVEDLRATAPRARGARRLAERFEVSVRTIQRDILALQEAGVPIWATPDPGGGYTIDPGHTLPPLNFTASEAAAIALALARSGPMPFDGAARTALHKLVAAMYVSEATVKTHLLRVFSKLGVDDRTAAVTVALERGIIRLPG